MTRRRSVVALTASAAILAGCLADRPDVDVVESAGIDEIAEPPTTDAAPATAPPSAPPAEEATNSTTTTTTPDETAADDEVETDDDGASSADDDAGSVDAGPVPAPDTDLAFSPCGQGECASVEVPIDPAQPELGTLDIAINVLRTSDPDLRQGYLLVNPGGPGASGKQFADVTPFFFGSELLDAFDIVGFDPRGVADSPPDLGCGGRDALRSLTDVVEGEPDTDDEQAALEAAVASCVEETGVAAPYLGTEFVAHDMDAIRAALGAEQISYYGASYGSEIGTYFASLYPESVRAMVVDGADNPLDELDTQDQRIEAQLEQLEAFEELLGLALDSCDSEACPIYNDGDPVAYYLDAMEKIGLVDGARPNLDDAGLFGVISTLYSESDWTELHRGVFELEELDDPTILAQSSDFQASDSDIREIEWISCLDSWSLAPEIDRETQLADAAIINEAFQDAFPLVAASSIEEDNTSLCPFFDTIVPAPLDVPLDGADVPILVIGNPSDPATPFSESVELVEDTLSNGYLLDADNPEHVVYGRGNTCVDDIVHRVLVDLEFPDERAVVCARR